MEDLAGKHIVLGLSGGIACYKSAELCRLLVKAGASVQVVMTEAATQFITPVTMQALSNRPVLLSQWDASEPNNMPHIRLGREPDAILIAPASADLMAQLAQGRAADLLTLTCLARPLDRTPLLLAPAMNREMWAHPATQRNAAQLRADGAVVLPVGQGDQACGEVGDGRMLEPQELLDELIAHFQPKVLAGQHVLVTAGPTFEAIDPVRGITNHSSGKMGFAVARAAREAGAEVTLVAGPVHLPTPRGVRRVDVQSALQMQAAVQAEVESASVLWLPLPWLTGDPPALPGRRSRRTAAACRLPWRLWRTRTFWRAWPQARVPAKAPCTAWALPPRATTLLHTHKPSASARACRCWWATLARPPLGVTTTHCCWWMLTARRNCRTAPSWFWRANWWPRLPVA